VSQLRDGRDGVRRWLDRVGKSVIRLDDNNLMMIEPKMAATVPIQDVWTRRALGLLFQLKRDVSYRGSHRCVCGASSTSFTLKTPQGRETNALLVHYVECHRSEIPRYELVKLYAEYMNWDLEKADMETE